MDLDTLTSELTRRFIQRRDVKAVQNPDGSWRPERSRWTKGDLHRHLRKEVVHGHYLVDPDGLCKLFALDIDLDKGGPRELWQSLDEGPERERLARYMLALAFGLAYRANELLELPMAVAYSGGKGMHVYGFFEQPCPAANIKQIATLLLANDSSYAAVKSDLFWKNRNYEEFTIEVFPKQGTVGDGGLGNLMRLPLGRNNKGRDLPPPYDRPAFMAEANLAWKVDDPVVALRKGSTRFAKDPWVGQA